MGMLIMAFLNVPNGMLQEVLASFLVVGLAELGDKTQISVFLLASQTKRYVELFVGVMLAFLVVDGVAVFWDPGSPTWCPSGS